MQSADAADVMQETLMAISASLERFDPAAEGATFRGWLWTIARNKMRDRQRLVRRRDEVDGSAAEGQFLRVKHFPEDPPSEAGDDLRLARQRVLELLRCQFDPRAWRMFSEVVGNGRAPEDVAAEMQVSKWAVYKAKARVLRRLKQEIAGLE